MSVLVILRDGAQPFVVVQCVAIVVVTNNCFPALALRAQQESRERNQPEEHRLEKRNIYIEMDTARREDGKREEK